MSNGMETGTETGTTRNMKGLAFNKVGLAIIVVVALAVAAYQLAFAEAPDGSADAGVGIEAVNAGSTPAAAVDAKTPGAKAAKKKAALAAEDAQDHQDHELSAEELMFGVSSTPAKSAGQSADKPKEPKGQGANKARIKNMTILYFGENDWNFIGVLTLRFVLNVFFAYILICLIFSKEHRIREYSFSYFVSNILIFMVTSLLASVRVRQGFAFGLFAILSILRFRTEQLQVREMTFLFAALILGVINSLATDGLTIFAVLWANVILCLGVFICDKYFMGTTDMINLVYDNTSLLAKDKKRELFEDIKKRFGYDVVKVGIIEMNYLTDSAKVKLVYKRDGM